MFFRYRASLFMLSLLAMALLAGCAGGPGPEDDAETFDQPPSSEDLTRQWGPDVQPDRVAEPVKFLYWRVDEIYRMRDGDSDGQLTFEEFNDREANFVRMDANGDGLLTKREIIEDAQSLMQ